MFETINDKLIRLDFPVTSMMIRKPMKHHEIGLSVDSTGYGSKIPTRYMVRTIDSKWRRVYCAIYSNIGTLYVMHGKNRPVVNLPFAD
jgi:hypothetical protein